MSDPTVPILLIRGQRVILDTDLAPLYGVLTKVLNQAVKRNPDRFPDDFMFQLTTEEVASLRSQLVTSQPPAGKRSQTAITAKAEAANWSQIVTSSMCGAVASSACAFTQRGALIAATVLRSHEVIQITARLDLLSSLASTCLLPGCIQRAYFLDLTKLSR